MTLTDRLEAVIMAEKGRMGAVEALLSWGSWVYERAVDRRRRRGGPGARLAVPVVSVGNLVMGGTGKTPMTVWVARALAEAGMRPAVISRGYKGTASKRGAVVSDGRMLLADARTAGDEPVLMARALVDVPVVVGRDRAAAGRTAATRLGADVLVADDAFSHLGLFRDVDLVLADACRPLGNGRVFPAGPLREPARALARAHALVLTRWKPGLAPCRDLAEQIGHRPVFHARHAPAGFVDVNARRPGCPGPLTPGPAVDYPPDFLKACRVVAFSGIAANAGFTNLLRSLKVDVVKMIGFADHHFYSRSDIQAVAAAARRAGAWALVTTEKDAVRLAHNLLPDLPVYALAIAMEVIESPALASWLAARLTTRSRNP